MRTLNIRLAAVLLAISVVFGLGVYLLHGYQVRRNADVFLDEANNAERRAEKAAEEGNDWLEQKAFKDAVRCLEWYVRLMPEKVDAREKLGLMLAERSRDINAENRNHLFRQAFGLLETTVGMDPERKDARKELVKMAMSIGRYQDAKDHLEGYLLKDSPKDPELLEQFAHCQLRMGDTNAALKTFQKAIECGPDQVTAYDTLARLLRSRFSQPKEADQWMEKLVEVNPKSSRAHLLRGRYLLAVRLRDEALLEASKALQLAPDDLEVLLLAAICHRVKGEYDEARRCVSRGIELHPDAVVMYATLADIEKRTGNHDEAAAVLKRGLKATDRHVQLLFNLADLLIDINRIEESRRFIQELQSAKVPQRFLAYIDFLLARTEFARGNWLRARQGFEKVRGAPVLSNMVSQIDVWIGECYGRLGNRDQQEKFLRRARSRDPTFTPAIAAMINANLATGKVDDALEGLRQLAVRGRAAPASALLIARMLLMKNVRQPPEKRNWKGVEAALDAAEKALPDSSQVPILRARVLLAQDRAADAEKLLREARDKDPKQTSFWIALTSLADRRGDWEQAEKLLLEADELFGDTAERRIARAQHLVLRYGKEAAERLRKLAENAESFSDDQQLMLWSGLLNAARQIDDSQQIDFFCRKIIEKQPNNVNVRYLLFERALRAADRPAVERALKEIERVAGQGAYWLYGQAVLLYLRGKEEQDGEATLEQALTYLAKARELRGDWSRVPLMEAGVYDALGKPNLALENYLKAFDMGDRNPSGVMRAVQLLLQTRQYAQADQLIRQLEREQVGLPPELIRTAAEIAYQQEEYDRALEMARKAASAESKNYRDHLWLGQMLVNLGGRAKAAKQDKKAEELLGDAEKALRRAVELEPQLSQVWVALVHFFSIVGEADKAEKALKEARLKIPAKEAPLALARCYEAMHKTEDAEKQYEAALDAAPQEIAVVRVVANFYAQTGKMQSAEALLQRIIDGKVPAETADVVWARRRLALIFATRRDYKSRQKARELIEPNLALSGTSAIDRRIFAQFSKPDQALSIIKEMIKDKTATPEDIFVGAKLYLAAGNWIEASNLFRTLVATYSKEPRYLVAFIEALLLHNEASSAEMYLDRLKEMAPKWFITVALEADLLCAKKQPEKALDLLKQFVADADPQSKDRDARLRLAADDLTRLSRKLTKPEQKPVAEKFADQAETWYRAYAKGSPGRNLLLAVFLGIRGKFDEALELLEQCIDLSTPQDFAQACIIISQGEKLAEEQARRLDHILDGANKKFQRHPALLLAQAELLPRQTRYAEAEGFYREVLEKYPENAVAMNNLAVLLALQGIKLDESLKLVDKAIELAGPLGAMLDSRASVYMALGEPQKAVEDLAAAVADAETPVRLFHQAQAYKMAGREEAAKKAMKKALEKNLSGEMLQPLELPAFEKMKQAMQ